MTWSTESNADALPDEVLATILKVLADLPKHSSDRTPPAPVAASRVNRRWRVIALASPELWTNIRISHRYLSQKWAAVFVERSLSHPLDISIDLKAYRVWDGMAFEAPIPLDWVLAIVGPHIGRWRTIALRGWSDEVKQFSEFVESSQVPPSRLESAHISTIDGYDTPPSVGELTAGQRFRALRVDTSLKPDDLTAFKAIRSLDIDYRRANIRSSQFRRLFGPSSSLTTLVIRNFSPRYGDNIDPIDCSTIRSFSVSFSEPFYFPRYPFDNADFGGFETLTNAFSLPNIEHLEILGGFSGGRIEDRLLRVPDDWEAPLFPYLQTLRLEDVGFSRTGLALIQHFSRNITALQLIYTTGNYHLLSNPEAWPTLRALTIEARVVVAPPWLVLFVTTRSGFGHPFSELTLPLWEGDITTSLAECRPPPVIHRQRTGPSPALMDGIYGTGFYIDEYDMRPTDFVHVPYPNVRKCRCCGIDWSAYLEWRFEFEIERLEEERAADLKAERENVRAKGMRGELRRERRREQKISSMGRGSKSERFSRRQRYDILEDFSVV